MLGSASNWSSIAKSLHRKTGRNIITFDARNHGKSSHTQTMSYKEMSDDLISVLEQNTENINNGDNRCHKLQSAILVGHSMGGRTCMYTALARPDFVSALVVVDVSPINERFNLEDGSEWNMDHYFYAMKAVKFLQPSNVTDWTMYKVLKIIGMYLLTLNTGQGGIIKF